MSLQPFEWAIRVGIAPGFLDQTGAPALAVSYIGKLLLWRWDEVMGDQQKVAWEREVQALGSGVGRDKFFWRELDHKKVGLYGYHQDSDADPMALATHPWALKKHEFEDAMSAIQDGNVPTNIPDDRTHVSAVLGVIAGVATAGAAGSLATGILAPAAPVLGTIATATGSAGGILAGVTDYLDGKHADRIKSRIVQFRDVYTREASYRKREAR